MTRACHFVLGARDGARRGQAMGHQSTTFEIETEQEEDGRWLAEIPAIAGVLAYGDSQESAATAAIALALRVLADRIDHGEHPADDPATRHLLSALLDVMARGVDRDEPVPAAAVRELFRAA